MTFPNYPGKHRLTSLLNPEDIVAYRRHLGRLPDIDFPEGLLFCLERGMPRRMRRRVPVSKAGSMLGDLYLVKRSKNKAGVLTDFGGGAPIVVELAEEFVALGAKRLLLMTWGGALQPNLKPGDIVVCDRAVRDEGTSQHYLPPAEYVSSDPQLVEALVGAIRRAAPNPSLEPPGRRTLRTGKLEKKYSVTSPPESDPWRWKRPACSPSARCAGCRPPQRW